MDELRVEVERREETGKNACRRLRAAGMIPAVVYGLDKDPTAIKVPNTVVKNLIRDAGSDNAVFLLELAGTGKSRHTMIRELRVDTMTRRIEHIDFQRVSMDQKVRVEVAIEPTGTPVGVKSEDGVLDFVTRTVTIECLPGKIPTQLELDVTELHVGQHAEAAALELPSGVELLDDPSRVLVSVALPAVATVDESEDEDGLLTEGAPTEPELIGKTKDDDEGEA